MSTKTAGFDVERWQRLNALLEQGLSIDAEERTTWLDHLPPESRDLADKLRGMLLQKGIETKEFLAQPVALQQIVQKGAQAADAAGANVGPYRLIAELGSGGMGTVWLAERNDDTIKRQVALKLPISHWIPGLAERMDRERDMLAALEHPNIARLYDAGVTETGRPYLALEYVEGESIDSYCQTHRLPVRQRLELFLQVTNAVAHAHARLIVHRDLKPNNILVTKNGEVRLLDFGVGKLIEDESKASNREAIDDTPRSADSGTANTSLTRITGRAITLDYASPEQIRSERITVASDVYSLGVVLFELLTGQRPYKLKRNTAGAVEDAIEAQDAPAASSVAEKPVARVLRGDVDVILAKAMKKETGERYASVEAFAADVKHFLKGEPVVAQRDSAIYRARKFVSRNIGGVIGGVVVFLAITAGTSIALWQAHVAKAETARATQVKQFIASLFTSAVPRTGEGGQVLASDLLTSAADRIEKELVDQPEIAAELGSIVSESFIKLGVPEKSERILEFVLSKSTLYLEPRNRITLSAKRNLASVLRARDPKRAEALLDDLMPDAAAMLPSTAEDLAQAHMQKAYLAARRADETSAVENIQRAVDLAEQYFGKESPQAIQYLGNLSNIYGVFSRRAPQLQAAATAYTKAINTMEGSRPNDDLINAETMYANALVANDRAAEAIPLLRRVVEDRLNLDTLETHRVRNARSSLANALLTSGYLDEGIALARKVVADELAANKVDSTDRILLGNQLVRGLVVAKLLDDAATEVARISGVAGQLSELTNLIRDVRLARLFFLRSDVMSAETTLDQIADTLNKYPAENIAALVVRAEGARLQNDFVTSKVRLDAALAALNSVPISLLTQANLSTEMGRYFLSRGSFDQAADHLNRCRSIYDRLQPSVSTLAADCYVGLAQLHLKAKEPAIAMRLLSPVVDAWSRVNPGNAWHGEALYWLSRTQAQLGQTVSADANFARAQAMLKRSTLPAMRELSRAKR